jgi:hypothetical protein
LSNERLKKLAKAQGAPNLENGMKVVGKRRLLIPERLKVQAEMRRLGEARLRGEIVDGNKESLPTILIV